MHAHVHVHVHVSWHMLCAARCTPARLRLSMAFIMRTAAAAAVATWHGVDEALGMVQMRHWACGR